MLSRSKWSPTLGAGVAGLIVFVLYLGVASSFTYDVTVDEGFGLVFNDMMFRLMHGDFSIDRKIISLEAFEVNGKTYTYFGVMPAFVRLPLMPFFDLHTQSVARLTCALAAAGSVFFMVASVLRIAAGRTPPIVLGTLLLCCGLSGLPFILTARSSIYVEAGLWSLFLISAFVFVLTKSFSSRLDWRRLLALALIAGVTLHARASTGIGLCLATSLLLLFTMVHELRRGDVNLRARIFAAARATAPAIATLAGFSLLALYVNYMRWGNPFVFFDLSRQLILSQWLPDRPQRLAETGLTNPARIWFGLQYYILPIWTAWDQAGHSIFSAWMRHYLDAAELPPSSIVLNQAVWLGFAWRGVSTFVVHRRAWNAAEWSMVLAMGAILVPVVYVLMFINMALRYQIEFLPLLLIPALYGLQQRVIEGNWTRGRQAFVVACGGIAVVASCITLLGTRLTPGPTDTVNIPAALASVFHVH